MSTRAFRILSILGAAAAVAVMIAAAIGLRRPDKPIARGAATNQQLLAMREQAEVTTAVSATRPSGGAAGVDITSWRQNALFGPPLAAIFLDGSTAQNLTSPTGGTKGPEVWGYVKTEWWLIGYLNNGSQIDIVSSSQGFVQEMQVIGVFERLAIAATISSGTTNARLFPIDNWQ